MISEKDFYTSPKYIALTAKVTAKLDTIPEYAAIKAAKEEASNRYKEAKRQMEEINETIAQAQFDQEKAKEEMNDIQKRVILDLHIKEPEDAVNVYYYLKIR